MLDDHAARPAQRPSQRCRRGGIQDVVVREGLALERRLTGRERAVVHVASRATVSGRGLMRVLPVPERVHLLECDGQAWRIRVARTGQARLIRQRDTGPRHPSRQDLGDPRVVGGRVPEGLHGERGLEPGTDAPLLRDGSQNAGVAIR